MFHDLSADVAGKLIRQDRFKKANCASQNRGCARKREFQRDQFPEVLWQGRVRRGVRTIASIMNLVTHSMANGITETIRRASC